jgi:hypothetical protein
MRIRLTVARNDLPRLRATFDSDVADGINHGIDTAIERADPLTRVDTGDLIANKTMEYASGGKLEGSVTWNMEYAAHQNYGTVYMSGTGFADEGAEQGGKAMGEYIARAIGG